MIFKTLPKSEYLADWPSHYFEIADVNEREACLKQVLKEHPDSAEDQRRLVLLQKRYGKRAKKNRGDLFMRAFMMILIASVNDFHSLNITAKEKELIQNLKQLAILDFERDSLLEAEWTDFAEQYLNSCINSHSYRTTLFGAVTLSDETVARKIAREIDLVTRITPAAFHLDKESSLLHEIMKQAYLHRVEGGEVFWENASKQ